MDALKKAEQAKGDARPDAGAADAAPAQAASPAPVTLPDLPLELEKLDADFTAEARPSVPLGERPPVRPAPVEPPPVIKPAQAATDRTAARNAFAAKQAQAPGGRNFAVAVGAATLLAVGVIGVYFWLQLRPAPSTLAGARPPATVEPHAVPVAGARQPAPAVALLFTPAAAEPPRAAAPQPIKVAATGGADAAGPRLKGDSDPIHITTSHLKVDPALTDGFNAFQAGDLGKAQAAYERALQDDPRSTDALRGAAAIALRQGRRADADSYYRRLLEADPLDAVALAGLVGLNDHADPVSVESRLKTLLASQPDAAVLHFALGNLYARQNRWSDAQQAYFDAVAGDGGNPDYLFNLAVSLDQLHKTNLAAQYYRQAMAAAAMQPAVFDQAAAAARLRQLQP